MPFPKRVRTILVGMVWLLVYFAAGKLGLRFALVNASATAVWPPTAIALALLLIEGFAFWPVVFLGAFVVNITTAGGVLVSLGIAGGNTLEALVAAYLVVRFAGGRRPFSKASNVFKFALAAAAGALVSASLGVAVLCLNHLAAWNHYGSIWATWWLGDVAGAIIFAPFILIWFLQPLRIPAGRKLLELGFFVALCVALEEFVFGPYSLLSRANYPIAFLWLPLMVWAAFRFGLGGTSAMMIALCPITIWQTLHGIGPFVVAGQINNSLLIAQTFTAVAAVTSLVIAAVVLDQAKLERSLRVARSSAELRVQERTLDLSASNMALKHAQDDLKQLSTTLMRTQDDERRRVARELHDSTGQSLAALKMHLQSLHDETQTSHPNHPEVVSAAIILLDEIVRDIRTLSHLLHPPLLDELGLVLAVRLYVEGFAKRSHVKVALDLEENLGRFEIGIETAAFRILQECLTNVHIHSGSPTASISITGIVSGARKALRIQIRDQGRGMPGDARAKPGVGIRGMLERIKMLGGELHIDTGHGGTTVVAVIPVTPLVVPPTPAAPGIDS